MSGMLEEMSANNKTRGNKYQSKRGYAGRTAEQLSAERRARLVESALTLFTDPGYQRSPIEKLCAHAHVTTRHFYEHFKSREDLLKATWEFVFDEMHMLTGPIFEDSALPPQARTEKAIGVFTRTYLGDRRLATVGSMQSIGVNPEIDGSRRQGIHVFAGYVEKNMREVLGDQLPPDWDSRLISIALAGAANELMVENLTAENPPTPEHIIQQLNGLIASIIEGALAKTR